MADFNFDDFMARALLHDQQEESQRERLKRNGCCPESLTGVHSEPNTSGNCVYCAKFLGRRQRHAPPTNYRSELDLAYHYFYDPDYGNDRSDAY